MSPRVRNLGIAGFGLSVLIAGAAAALLCENALRLPPQLRNSSSLPESIEVTVEGSGGILLIASWLTPRKECSATVLLFHGVADSRTGILGQARMLVRDGFCVLAADSRGHGRSSGDLFTFGVREVDDVRRWVSWVQTRHPGKPVYGLGESMGASILIQAAGAGVPFRSVVAEAPFRTFREVALYRMAQKAPVIGPLLVTPAFWYARLRYGLDLDQASPLEAMRLIKVPALIIHGSADTNIPPDHGRDLAAAGGACAQFWSVSGGGHTDAIARQPAEFERRVLAWFSATAPPAGCPRS